MFTSDVTPRSLTRRQALCLGAAAATLLGPLRPGRAAARGASPGGVSERALDLGDATAGHDGWRTSPVLDAPHPFDLVGLRWAPGTRAEAQVRARPRGGAWTRWTTLPAQGGHGPDAGRAGGGTEPAWTGRADQLQVRLRGHVRHPRARYVHAAPDARAAGRRPAALLSARPRRQLGVPPVIPRAQWGGDTVIPRAAPAYGQVQLAFVHHTVNANDYGPEDSAAIVLGIARYHRDANGWNDVGYNFLVDRYGQIFEGRAGGVDQPVVGAQAQGFNSVSTGVACIGTFSSVTQTEAGMDALARVIGWKLALHAVPVAGVVTVTSAGGETNRYPAGTAVTLQRVSGHRDGNATSCPGDGLYGQLADLRVRAARYAAAVSALTVRASSTTVRGPVAAQITGWLRFADGSPPAGAPVEVSWAPAGGAPTVLATVACSPDGQWAATVTLPRTGTVRARFPGDATRPALESSAVRITVLPRLAADLAARSVRRGRRLALSGSIDPPDGAGRLALRLERRVGGRWLVVRRRVLPVRDGRFAARLRPVRAGRHRVILSVPGASVRRGFRVTG